MSRSPVPAVSGIILNGDQVLLVKRAKFPGKGFWSLPGGRVEFGETLEQALIRELKEELGIRAQIQELIGVYDAIGAGYHFVIACYLVRMEGNPVPGSDILEIGWFHPDQLSSIQITPTALRALKDAGIIS